MQVYLGLSVRLGGTSLFIQTVQKRQGAQVEDAKLCNAKLCNVMILELWGFKELKIQLE